MLGVGLMPGMSRQYSVVHLTLLHLWSFSFICLYTCDVTLSSGLLALAVPLPFSTNICSFLLQIQP